MDISGVYLCSRCMRPIEEEAVCPYCGYDHREQENENPALSRGTLLNGRYQLGSVIGFGGFGITYAAYDEVLQTPVAIKEYFPREFARRDTEETDDLQVSEENRSLYQVGREHFIREARVLGMMKDIRGVVTVQDYFEENETAYIVMEYIRGTPLEAYAGKVKPGQLFAMLREPIDALTVLHKQGILHRDITPSNLLVQEDGSVKLIDFGAAARMDREQSMILITKRYAPLEQYGTSGQALGPWTDIYGLCATIYHVLTGEAPPDALSRSQKDELIPLGKRRLRLKSWQARAVMKGLEVNPKKRPQSMEEFRSILYNTPMPEEIRLRRKIRRQYGAATAGILLAGAGIFWAVTGSWMPSRTLLDVNETDFKDYSPSEDDRADADVLGNSAYRRSQIGSITFLDSRKEAGEDAWDVSDERDGSVLAWVQPTESDASLYDLYIGAEGGVKANENCSYAFAGFENAGQITFAGHFDTGETVSMVGMFQGCVGLTEIDLEGFRTEKVREFDQMFSRCYSLTSLDVSMFDTAGAEDFSGMFRYCRSLESLKLGGLDTKAARDLNAMFEDCAALKELDVSGFDTARVTDMDSMFAGCASLEELDVSGFDTARVTDMASMFEGCAALKELDVSGFDTSRVERMSSLFENCGSLKKLDLAGWDTSLTENMNSLFHGCASLEELNLEGLDTSQVTSMSYMFADCASLTSLDLKGLDVSQVTSMAGMFSGCGKLSSLLLSGWDTSGAESMSYMFADCFALETVDVSGFDTSGVKDLSSMFSGCRSLRELDLKNFANPQAEDMSWMFQECYSLKELDLSGFGTSRAEDMSWMFCDCVSLTGLDLTGWDTKHVSDMKYMFYNCRSLADLDLTNLDTSALQFDSGMLDGTVWEGKELSQVLPLTGILLEPEKVDFQGVDWEYADGSDAGVFGNSAIRRSQIGTITFMDTTAQAGEDAWDVSLAGDGSVLAWTKENGALYDLYIGGEGGVKAGENARALFACFDHVRDIRFNGNFHTGDTADMSILFYHCRALEELDLSGLDTAQTATMRGMFEGCENLKKVNLSGLSTEKVIDMSFLFYGCSSLKEADVSGFDTSRVTDMSGMFYNCMELEELDVSGFDTGNAAALSWMFYSCIRLEELDVSGFDTSKTTAMRSMFYDCRQLTSLDVRGFDTGNVTDMGYMFYGCSSLRELDVSGFETGLAQDMSYMFYGCLDLAELDLSGFDMERVRFTEGMLTGTVLESE